MQVEFYVNDKPVSIEVDPMRRLLDILREDLNLTGAKEGCGKGECGSCTVFMDGVRVNACLVPALQLNESRIYTIEGVQKWPVFKKVEKVFTEHGAVQCGFCIPGMVMSALAIFNEMTEPFNANDLKFQMAGNMCRCTGYTKIAGAIIDLSKSKTLITEIKSAWPE